MLYSFYIITEPYFTPLGKMILKPVLAMDDNYSQQLYSKFHQTGYYDNSSFCKYSVENSLSAYKALMLIIFPPEECLRYLSAIERARRKRQYKRNF